VAVTRKQAGKEGTKRTERNKAERNFSFVLSCFLFFGTQFIFPCPKENVSYARRGKTGGVAGGSKEDSEEESVDSKEED